MELAVVFSFVAAVVVWALSSERRARIRALREAALGPEEDWVDDGLQQPLPIWNHLGLPLTAFTAEVTLNHEERNDQGVVLIPRDVRVLVALTWEDSEDTRGLRASFSRNDGPFAPLIAALIRHDNFQPPGGDGLCHARPGLSEGDARGIAQGFADAAMLLLRGEEAMAALLHRARDGEPGTGVDALLLMRTLPQREDVQELARSLLHHDTARVACAAAVVTKDSRRAVELALNGRNQVAARMDALDLAMELLPEQAEQLAMRALDQGGAIAKAAISRAGRIGTDDLAERLLEDVADAPEADRPEYAAAFAGCSDAASGRWLGLEVVGAQGRLRDAAARSIRRRQPREASEPLVRELRLRGVDALLLELLGLVGTLPAVAPLLTLADTLMGSDRDDVELCIAMIQDREGKGDLGGLALSAEGGGLAVVGEGGLAIADEGELGEEEPEPPPRRREVQ